MPWECPDSVKYRGRSWVSRRLVVRSRRSERTTSRDALCDEADLGGRCRAARKESALVDRQGRLVELEDGEIAGRHIDRADHASRPTIVAPTAVGGLSSLILVEDGFAVLAPGQRLVGARLGHDLLEAILAE